MKQQLNEQISRIRQIIESIEDYDFEKTSYNSNNTDDTEKDILQNIHFVEKSDENSVIVGMTFITSVPSENSSENDKEVKIDLEIEWVVYMEPFGFPGVNNTNFYIKSIRKMEINPKVNPYLEIRLKSFVKEGKTLRGLLTTFYEVSYYDKYTGKIEDTSPIMTNMNKNLQTIAEIIKHKTIYLKSKINVNDYLKPTPTPTGDQRDPKIKKLEQEASKYDTVGEFRKSNLNMYQQYNVAVRKGLIQNRFDRRKWTVEKLEQEASKYNSPREFSKSDVSGYNFYRMAVRKGLIQDRFLDNRVNNKWTIDKLEQEVSKYDKQSDLYKNNIPAFNAYKRAVKKGLIQDRFKKNK
jgi:hypothetical protein